MERLRRALKIRHGEGAVVLRLLALMLVAWTGFALGGSGVESLFFARFGTRHLPWMYIALGLVTFPVTLGVTALLGRGRRGPILVSLPLTLAVLVVAMRALLFVQGRWIYPALWLAMMVAWIVLGIVAWAVAGLAHDTRQAKRLFPLYGAAVILGGAVGGALTAPLAAWAGAENLLLFWAASLAGASMLAASVVGRRRRTGRPRRGAPRAPRPSLLESMREGYGTVRRSTLLRWMALSLLLLGLLYFTLSLPFAVGATARFPSADRLAGFLGLFTGAVNAVALAVSLVAANRLFARFGVATMVTTFPLIYLAGYATLAATDTFPALVGFRFVQLVWMFGVWTTAWQALWGVVPPEHRDQARTFLEGGPFQAGVILAGVLLLVAQRMLTPRLLFVIAAVLATGALAAGLRVRRAYSGAVVEALRAGWPEVFVPEEEPFGGIPWDRAGLAALEAGARDEDPGVRRIAVTIMSQIALPDGIEVCRRAGDDPDPVVRAAAARGIARSRDPTGGLLRLLQDDSPEVRVAAAEALSARTGPQLDGRLVTRLEEMLSDPDRPARLAAAVALHKDTGDPRAAQAVRSAASSSDPTIRARAVAALAEVPPAGHEVVAFLGDPDPEVRRAAASALAGSSDRGTVDALVASLGDTEPAVREAAARALAASGPDVVADVVAALGDEVRAEGALVALSHLPAVDPAPIRAFALRESARARESHRLWQAIASGRDEGTALLAYALRSRAVGHARRAYAALVPLGDHGSLEVALENLQSRDPTQRANALESFESVGDPDIVRPLLPVWEPEPRPGGDGVATLETLLEDPEPWIRACAARAAAGVDSVPLRERLAALAEADPDPFVRETARHTVEGDTVETLSTLPLMDRILALRQVPLFRELSPEDLKRVAEAATERLYPDGSLLAELGDPGDAMHVVVTGEVRVLLLEEGRGEVEVARRGRGYIVGEMAILSDQPRMASLLAVGDVRTLSLDRSRFQRILRERPDAALAVMRELCARLREASIRTPARGSDPAS